MNLRPAELEEQALTAAASTLPQTPHRAHFRFPLRLALASLLLVALMAALALRAKYEPYLEGRTYYRMAEGSKDNIYFYYAGRVVHPRVAAWAADALRTGLQDGFRAVAWAGVVAFAGSILLLVGARAGRPGIISGTLLLLTPAVYFMVWNYYFQDLLFNAILAVIIACYSRAKLLAIAALPLLMLTRESALILAVLLIIVEVIRRNYWTASLVGVVAFAANLAVRLAVSHGTPNKHGVGILTTNLLKVVYNFLRSFLGIVLWVNSNSDTTTCQPVLSVHLPAKLGNIQSVGLCGWDPAIPVATLTFYLSTFGLMVPLAILAYRAAPAGWLWKRLRTDPVWACAAAYGLLMLILAPLVGTWPERYFVYAWPLCAALLALLPRDSTFADIRTAAVLAATHVFICWLPQILTVIPAALATRCLVLAIIIAAHIAVLPLLRERANRLSFY